MSETMRDLVDELFAAEGEKLATAKKAIESRRVTSAEDARAILAGFSRTGRPSQELFGSPHYVLLSSIQSCDSETAWAVFRQEGAQAIIAAYPSLDESVKTFGLKILAFIGSKDALLFVAERIAEESGPSDFLVAVALEAVQADTPHLDVLFPALSPVLGYADFRAVAVLDLANRLALAGNLEPHPAADYLHQLRGFIESTNDEEFGRALSSCLALAFIPGRAAEKLLLRALDHQNPNVRVEAAYSLTRRDHPDGPAKLIQAALDPFTARRAVAYLDELGRAHLVPDQVKDPVFAATAEMLSWLSHPMEYGRPPESIELWDRRTIYWPPTEDTRELFLFKYSYPAEEGDQPEAGVGLVGGTTFSLFGETRPAPEGTPEDALAAHCVWELEMQGDPRGEGRDIDVGRKLLGFETARSS